MGIDFSFSSSGYLDVSVPRVPSITVCIPVIVTSLQLAGFPHSDITGSKPACGSPMLFAACHVLLRRLVPWHPPCALVRLITYPETSLQFFRSIDFPFCNWSSKTSFSSFFIVQLSRCAAIFRLPSKLFAWKWVAVDSNHRPLAYQASALTS